VGDKTVIFRLIDDQMYWHMMKDDDNMTVARGIALHKMIRLVTASTINGGYLNFMGNEFGHPEWIDFPREGNGWSYKYARRQWDLVDRKELKYVYLNDFDNAMIHLISGVYNFQALPVEKLWEKDDDQVLAYKRGDLVFVFNFNPFKSFDGYGILTPPGQYDVVLSTDNPVFGGYGNIDETVTHFTKPDKLYSPHGVEWLKLYLPARSAQVLRRRPDMPGRPAAKKAPAKATAPKTTSTTKKSAATPKKEAAPKKTTAAKKTAEKKSAAPKKATKK
ncbi:MAG: alpha amylase C-terminal domain-containing protein, partial [Paramuribaculum sp.]|nr:alpha amylase C-terminal domain-containing protein [Paramuribaculum sp.]